VRYLILTDQHGNLQALDAVLADANSIGYDRVLVLGDLVGYGADPAAIIERTLALAPEAMIRGNHDKVAAGLEPASLFNDVARQSIEWTASVLSTDDLRVLADLPKGPRTVIPGLEICHGTPFDEDHYVFDTGDAARAIAAASAPICLFGHTHVPVIFSSASRPRPGRDDLTDDEIELPSDGCVLINVGSVGQPRDGDPRAAYGILDLERRTIVLRRVPYDIAAAQARIIAAGLPAWLALRLERGQ
jgi:diadenosine tetraphosphatase ApaH/serine/threonine PP2A family protein phosphatase